MRPRVTSHCTFVSLSYEVIAVLYPLTAEFAPLSVGIP
jgi:hypothetical protein